jgi:hypothetical protein
MLQILDTVIVGHILLYFIVHALEFFCFFQYDIAELCWFCMDFLLCRPSFQPIFVYRLFQQKFTFSWDYNLFNMTCNIR